MQPVWAPPKLGNNATRSTCEPGPSTIRGACSIPAPLSAVWRRDRLSTRPGRRGKCKIVEEKKEFRARERRNSDLRSIICSCRAAGEAPLSLANAGRIAAYPAFAGNSAGVRSEAKLPWHSIAKKHSRPRRS